MSGPQGAGGLGPLTIPDARAGRAAAARAGYVVDVGKAEPFLQCFIGGKEKRLVSLDRAAHRAAVLIPPIGRQAEVGTRGHRRVIEKIAGVERVVAQILKKRTMPAVGPPFADHEHLSADSQTVFGAEGVGDHPPFPDSFESRQKLRDWLDEILLFWLAWLHFLELLTGAGHWQERVSQNEIGAGTNH